MKKKTTQRIFKLIYTVLLPILVIITDVLLGLSNNIAWDWLIITIVSAMNLATISVAIIMLVQLSHVRILPELPGIKFETNSFKGIAFGFGKEGHRIPSYILLLPFVYFTITLKFKS